MTARVKSGLDFILNRGNKAALFIKKVFIKKDVIFVDSNDNLWLTESVIMHKDDRIWNMYPDGSLIEEVKTESSLAPEVKIKINGIISSDHVENILRTHVIPEIDRFTGNNKNE
jgi:hypothetical protein